MHAWLVSIKVALAIEYYVDDAGGMQGGVWLSRFVLMLHMWNNMMDFTCMARLEFGGIS